MKDTLVIKSKHDIRNYRVIKIENDLETLIVNDHQIPTREGHEKEGGQVNMVSILLISILFLKCINNDCYIQCCVRF